MRRLRRSLPSASSATSSVLVPPISRPMRSTGASERLVPGNAEPCRALDHADHAVSLRKVSPQLSTNGIDMFREQPQPVAPGQHRLEQRARLVAAAEARDRVDIPERADDERI